MDSQSITGSDSFRFIVGENETVFSVDPIPFTQASVCFGEKINHPSPGTRPNEAVLPDLNTETFEALKAYVYTRDYETPRAPQHDDGSTSYKIEDLSKEGKEAWKAERMPLYKMYTSRCQGYLDERLGLKDSLDDCKPPTGRTHEPEKMNCRGADYTPVFMCHAKLYFAGKRYEVVGLAELALHKLCRTIEVWVDWYEVLPDLVVLLSYVCEKAETGDRMRKILRDFVALKYSDYQYHPVVARFLQANSQFLMEATTRISEEKNNAAKTLGNYRDDDIRPYPVEA
ncbi:hypothetical protein F4810DRAFT_722456 [Camillea tinctor]|nr:hypothetical protein F4810DRAFT_722456 [Camillea tinctor]